MIASSKGRTYVEWNVSMSPINRTNCEARVPCHCTMNGTVSKKCAVHIIRRIAWNSADHVGGICQARELLVGYIFVKMAI